MAKATLLKVITRELVRRQIATVKVFDSALNWLFDFSDLQYQLIGEASELHNIDNCIYDLTLVDDPEYINRVLDKS